MPLLTFAIYTGSKKINHLETVAVNILMSFTLYSLLCLYNMSMNDVFVEKFNSRCGELLMIGFRLSLNSHFVENNGFEPLTPCVQGRCSSQLS